ncbi:unnamed protein product [Cylicostephanus goldi]|uniref:Uncharacterized protein n=1 Tax=Cylicostephanus goldi TaxID=71465 RepID=A0A3P7N1F5_CYLGO|nr:unnamed protein product [Cylicostephanus goldi]
MVSSRKRIHSVNTHAGNPNAITQATLNGLTRLAGSGAENDTSPPHAVVSQLRRLEGNGTAYLASPTKFTTANGTTISFSKVLEQVETQYSSGKSRHDAVNESNITSEVLAPQPIRTFVTKPEQSAKLIAPKAINPVATMKKAYEMQVSIKIASLFLFMDLIVIKVSAPVRLMLLLFALFSHVIQIRNRAGALQLWSTAGQSRKKYGRGRRFISQKSMRHRISGEDTRACVALSSNLASAVVPTSISIFYYRSSEVAYLQRFVMPFFMELLFAVYLI